MALKISGGVQPLTLLVNGVAVGDIDSRRQRLIDPPGPGFARLTVIDATGRRGYRRDPGTIIRRRSPAHLPELWCCLPCRFIVCERHG